MAASTASASSLMGKIKADTTPGTEPAVGDPTERVKTNKNAAKVLGNTSKVPPHGDEAHTSAAPFKSKSYEPFKMLGHEHPGIKQRTPATLKSFDVSGGAINGEMVDGVSTTPNKMASVGSSPTKLGLWSGIMDTARKKWGNKNTDKTVDTMGAPVEGGGDGGAVPPHGDEAHTGGAVGGEPKGFQAMDFKEFKGMGAKDRMGYMKGLSREDRMSQMKSNHESMASGGGGGGGWGGFSNAIGGMFSDIRLKEKIEKTGKSPSGIPVYEFNYIGDNNRYSGVMAQDLIEMNIDAVSIDDSGFYKVNYNNIDVDMHLIN